ncbi:MAG: transposase [Pseudonocardia sp.]|nr:MAG: transposase [Pseudonocardia sp.]
MPLGPHHGRSRRVRRAAALPGTGSVPIRLLSATGHRAGPHPASANGPRAVVEIRAIHSEHRGTYGASRVHAELRARGG